MKIFGNRFEGSAGIHTVVDAGGPDGKRQINTLLMYILYDAMGKLFDSASNETEGAAVAVCSRESVKE